MASVGRGETRNTISGGTQGIVLQGRDFRDIHIGDIVQAAPAPVALAQLPALVPGFTGREQDLAEITALLDPTGGAGTVVVSAVAGLAGVGKTALAIQAAYAVRQAGRFPGGVLFLDLHGYDDAPVKPGQALDALLRALGVSAEHIPPSTEERAALYRSVLANIRQPVLIIADNASSEAQVRLLIPGPGPHRVMVTSRHTLAGLGARLLDVTVLDPEVGTALLDAALRAARPDDDRISADRPGAIRLAGICGGLPLALQITAALLNADPTRPASDLAGELADEIQRLKALRYDDGSGSSAPSVAAAFELSYRQLDEAAACVFRLLPVNPGPDVSLPAIAALTDRPVNDVRKVVGQLARAHLVEAAAGAGSRWRMHDLLRLYASQLSDARADDDGQEQARDRVLRYYLDTAAAANAHLMALPDTPMPADFTSRDTALAWLDAERPTLVAAATMAASTGRDRIAMLLPQALTEYLMWRRRFDDLLSIALTSRDAAHRLADRKNEGKALDILGSVLLELRRFEEAVAAHQAAAAIFREIGDRVDKGTALGNLGLALQAVGRTEEAITQFEDIAAIWRDIGDRYREGLALDNLGLALRDVHRPEEAVAAHRAAAAISRETGDRHGNGMTLTNLGLALHDAGRMEEAITTCQEAAAILRETGDRWGEGVALNSLASALRDAGRFDEAVAAYQEAVEISRETGDRHREGVALDNLGVALGAIGQVEEAITRYQEAAAIFKETGDQSREGAALGKLCLVLRDAGRLEEAIVRCQEAAAIFREIGDRHREGTVVDILASMQRDGG